MSCASLLLLEHFKCPFLTSKPDPSLGQYLTEGPNFSNKH